MEEVAAMDRRPFVSYMAYIPANVRHHETLSANAKVFYAEITALSQKEGYCFASNAYFAEQFKMSDRTVSRLISELEEYGFISVKIVKNGQTGKVLGRRIYPDIVADELVPEGKIITLSHPTKLSEPVDKLFLDQSTELSCGSLLKNNIKNNTTGARTRTRKKADIDAAAKEELKAWAMEQFGEEAKEQLIPRLMDFADMRRTKQNPKPITVGRSVTLVTNGLLRFSDGSILSMLALLDQSIAKKWDLIYELRDDYFIGLNSPDKEHDDEGGLPWV